MVLRALEHDGHKYRIGPAKGSGIRDQGISPPGLHRAAAGSSRSDVSCQIEIHFVATGKVPLDPPIPTERPCSLLRKGGRLSQEWTPSGAHRVRSGRAGAGARVAGVTRTGR